MAGYAAATVAELRTLTAANALLNVLVDITLLKSASLSQIVIDTTAAGDKGIPD